ncbi:MAG: hypothetical protein ACI8ZB_000246 [Desulforhopalus sp.]|jgi:hypothetical protein
MQKNTNHNNVTQTNNEISLEELDVLCRKFNHLHDEKIATMVGRFFTRIADLFRSGSPEDRHPAAR